MIPTIGLMIGAYIVLRCIEIFATLDRIPSRTNQGIVGFTAAAVILVTVFCGYGLLDSSITAAEVLKGVSPSGIFQPPR